MKYVIHALSFVLCVSCTNTKPGDSGDPGEIPLAPFDEELASTIQEVVSAAAADLEAGGVVVGVSLPGIEPFMSAAGMADDDRAMTIVDRFRIGSITKTFVAAVTLDLVDEGVLSLDEPVSGHVDGVDRGDEITIRHLLSHTSGLKEYSSTPTAQSSLTSEWTDAELIALVAGAGLLGDPGTHWSYANTNYILLGMVIESATGIPWNTQVDERLSGPLGMEETRAPGAGDDWSDTVRGFVGAHDYTNTLHPSVVGAAGNIESDARDLLTWGDEFLSGNILSEEMHEAMLADMLWVVDDVLLMGLGVFQFDGNDWDHPPLTWHNGAVNGYGSWLGHEAESGATVVALVNNWPLVEGSPNINVSQTVAFGIWDLLEGAE